MRCRVLLCKLALVFLKCLSQVHFCLSSHSPTPSPWSSCEVGHSPATVLAQLQCQLSVCSLIFCLAADTNFLPALDAFPLQKDSSLSLCCLQGLCNFSNLQEGIWIISEVFSCLKVSLLPLLQALYKAWQGSQSSHSERWCKASFGLRSLRDFLIVLIPRRLA